jgi:hypothetical protein
MTSFRRSIACLLALAIVSPVRIAGAEKDTKKEAARHRKAANTAFEVSDYDRAIDEFKRAYELAPDARLFYNLGLSHLKRYELGRRHEDLVQARDYFNRFLGLMTLERAKPRERKRIVKMRRLAKGQLDRIVEMIARVPPPPVEAPATSTITAAPPPPPPPPPIEAPAEIVLTAPPQPTPFPLWTVFAGAAGLTGVLAIVTGVLALSGSNAARDSALAGDFAEADSRGDRARAFGYATDSLIAATLISSGLGIWLAFD